jgi:hypothetical protein
VQVDDLLAMPAGYFFMVTFCSPVVQDPAMRFSLRIKLLQKGFSNLRGFLKIGEAFRGVLKCFFFLNDSRRSEQG